MQRGHVLADGLDAPGDLRAGHAVLRRAEPEAREAYRVRQSGDGVPVAPVHRGRLDREQHLVVSASRAGAISSRRRTSSGSPYSSWTIACIAPPRLSHVSGERKRKTWRSGRVTQCARDPVRTMPGRLRGGALEGSGTGRRGTAARRLWVFGHRHVERSDRSPCDVHVRPDLVDRRRDDDHHHGHGAQGVRAGGVRRHRRAASRSGSVPPDSRAAWSRSSPPTVE